MTRLTLEEAKDRVRIPELWREFGYDGEPKKQCRCPFHADRNPSFSVFDEDRRWTCHAGCGGGTVIDFLAIAKGLSDEDACHEILRRAEGYREPVRHEPTKLEQVKLVERPKEIPYSKELAQRVADSRGLRITSVEFAALWLKTLIFGRVCDQECWILSDGSGNCSEARRFDAKPFPAIGTLGERKSHTVAGSRKSWPVGVLPPGFEEPWLREHVHRILLVEGGPDYLACCQIIAEQDTNVLPVAMLGASQSISQAALPYFTGRRVTVIGHPDKSGREAATNWGTQIQGAGGLVQPIHLKNGDLCDHVVAGATFHDIGTINSN